MKKISNKEVKEQILAAIGKEIDKRGEFQTAGIAFFGYEFEVSLKLTLVARGERQAEIYVNGGEGYTGEQPPEDGDREPLQKTEVVIPVSGKGGKKTKKAREQERADKILAALNAE